MSELKPCPFCGKPLYIKVKQYSKPILAPLTYAAALRDELIDITGENYVPVEAKYCPVCGRPLGRRASPENEPLTWIPVNERLPETDTPVLCHCSNNHLQHLYQRVGYWSTDKVWHDSWDGREIPVDYWMPLPNARKPEGSETP